MSRREKKNLTRIIISLVLFAAIFTADKIIDLSGVIGGGLGWLLPLGLYLCVYVIIGYDVVYKAVRNIGGGQFLDENFLMVVATFGAFGLAIYRGVSGLSTDGFDEACAVLLFYQIGEFFQRYATGKSRKSISSLMDIRPDYANVKRNGEIITVDPSEVSVGEIIVVNPGEKIPLDGKLIKGSSSIDTKALTGESLPREVSEGDGIVSGTVNLTSQIEIEVEKEFYDSTAAKILDLVENAASKKAKAENFITQFARYYTPSVVGIALILAVLPPIFTGEWSVWIYRALSFLVVSCPCALVISIPLSFFAGIGRASADGILVKGSDFLERLEKADTFVFDKTGTLTKGNFAVKEIYPAEREDEILRCAAIAEEFSSHPIAECIKQRYGAKAEGGYTPTNFAGEGIVASNGNDEIACGNEKLMKRFNVNFTPASGAGTVVYVAQNGAFSGYILIADEVKKESAEVIEKLNRSGSKTVMLTGDNELIAAHIAKETGISSFKASLLPEDKEKILDGIITDKKARGEKGAVCFVGDGINDAPVIVRADIGFAMGGVGSDAAIEAADVVLMNDDLRSILKAQKIAKKTMRIVRENIIFSLGVKAVILVLSALGITNMWIAVFGDVGVAVIAILNAMRLLIKDKRDR